MDDRIRPILLIDPDQDIILSTFDGQDAALPALCVDFTSELACEEEDFYALAAQKVAALREEYGEELLMAGCVPARRLELEPHGEALFAEAVQIYANLAEALQMAGCDVAAFTALPTLEEARAAVLGARSSELPVWITVDLDREGEELEDGADVLATFLTLQGMGVAGFGFGWPDSGDMMLPHLERIAPHAAIPLIARPECVAEDRERVLSPAEFSDMAQIFCRLGVSICGGGYGATSGHLLAAKTALNETPKMALPLPDDDDILLCTEKQVFYLDGNLEFSEPVECAVDMAQELLEAEESGCDVVCILLENADDGYRFFLNSYLLELPVCFYADDEESLEAGLFFYPGSAVIDSRSLLERERLEALAKRYGAIVL